MTQRRFAVTLAAVGLIVSLALLAPPTANAEKATPKLRVDGDRLVVIAARQETTFDGIYKNGRGESIEFADGEPLSINIGIGELRRKSSIDGVRIEDGKVVFTDNGDGILLANGKYQRQGDPEPQPKPEPEPQPCPNPNAFEVKGGDIVAVWL